MQFYGIINKNYEGMCINVQCTSHQGFPSFEISGLADNIVKESKERVRECIRASGFRFPQESILISLAPSGIHKTGSALDLPIALSILFSKSDVNIKVMALGEVDLNGDVLPVPGESNALLNAEKQKCHVAILHGDEESTTKNTTYPFYVIKAKTLQSVSNSLISIINEASFDELDENANENTTNIQDTSNPFSGIIGLNSEKELITAAIVGGHSVLLFGPKGVGKTMLLGRVKGLLPLCDEKERDELSRIRACFALYPVNKGDVIYLTNRDPLLKKDNELPEILLSHSGVVIADEITNLDEKTLFTIREILDKGTFTVLKNGTFPLRFSFIGAMNPCPCGALGSKRTPCTCAPNKIQAHLRNITGPLLSRFSAVYDVREADYLHDNDSYFSDAKDRIKIALERMKKRYLAFPNIHRNADLVRDNTNREAFEKAFMLFPESENPRDALSLYSLALTLSDLDDSEIKPIHVEKARMYRIKDIYNHYER